MSEFLSTPSRELRDLMNLCLALTAITTVNVYAVENDPVSAANAALNLQIESLCKKYEVTEPDCWSFFDRLRTSEGFSTFTIKSLQTFYAEASCTGR